MKFRNLNFLIVMSTLLFVSASDAATSPMQPSVSSTTDDASNYVDFKRGAAATKLNLNLGPFAYAEAGKFGLLARVCLEFWNLEKNYIQAIGAEIVKGSATSINVSGAFYFEALPRLYAGPSLGVEYKNQTGFAGLTVRLLGAEPLNQKPFSILYTQIDMGLKASSTPYGALSFGLKLF